MIIMILCFAKWLLFCYICIVSYQIMKAKISKLGLAFLRNGKAANALSKAVDNNSDRISNGEPVKFKAALDNNTHKAKIDADAEAGNKAGINGTPAFVINGYYVSGAQPEAAFKKLINRALKEAEGK